MKVSTKGRYGLRALVDLTAYLDKGDKSHVSLVEIASRQNISLNYLEQVFSILRKAGIVKSIKGAQGGYILGDQPNNIKVAVVLQSLEGEFCIVEEREQEENIDNISVAVRNLVWNPINESVNKYLYSTTLKDLAEEYSKLEDRESEIYFI